jgi:hypothetical protein
MANQTLADQLLKAIRPLWGDEANALRDTWRLSGLNGDDPELLEWLAGQIETLLVVPFLVQADLNLSVSNRYRKSKNGEDGPPLSFDLELPDGTAVQLTRENEDVSRSWSEAREQWESKREPMAHLAFQLKTLRELITRSFEFNPSPPTPGPTLTDPPRRRRREP